MNPTTVLVLGVGLAVVGMLVKSQPMRIVLVLVAVGGFLGALIFLWLGYVGATDDVGSSWSDSGPQRALQWAGSLAAAGLASLVALIWRHLQQRRDERR